MLSGGIGSEGVVVYIEVEGILGIFSDSVLTANQAQLLSCEYQKKYSCLYHMVFLAIIDIFFSLNISCHDLFLEVKLCEYLYVFRGLLVLI